MWSAASGLTAHERSANGDGRRGKVTSSNFSIPVSVSGAGWDNHDADSSNVATACYFAQRGTLEGHVIKLHGANLLANNPAVLGF